MPPKNMILPAIIAHDQEELDKMLGKIPFADNIMLDLMDGKFVETISLNFQMRLPKGPRYQLHLMVVNPLDQIKKTPKEVDTVIIHEESLTDIAEAIQIAKEVKLRIFIALNPETSTKLVMPYLDEIDGVLIMTVKPGQYGARFLPEQLKKVREFREISEKINIEVDGGMNDKTIGLAIAAGANMIASGSFIMKSKNPEAAYNILNMFF
jgi:ribulose-phosphate 3-epimerase